MIYKGNIFNLLTMLGIILGLFYFFPPFATGVMMWVGITSLLLMSYGQVGIGFKR